MADTPKSPSRPQPTQQSAQQQSQKQQQAKQQASKQTGQTSMGGDLDKSGRPLSPKR